MARMGHDNPRAALIYQHASAEADKAIADAVSALVNADREKVARAGKAAAEQAQKDAEQSGEDRTRAGRDESKWADSSLADLSRSERLRPVRAHISGPAALISQR